MSRHTAKAGLTTLVAAALASWTTATAAPSAREALPAAPPIGGALWTVAMPIVLFAVSLLATYALYRHFSDD